MNIKYIAIINLKIVLLYVDLFCGAGGTSTGIEKSRINGDKTALVISCVNHDANAIKSHAENHPNTQHFTEDIRTLDITSLVKHVDEMRCKYPFAKLILWASLECTNFSRAKGGQARDGDSRTLAEHLFRYIEFLNPDCVQIENVEEFMSWGAIDENGKPISKLKGIDFIKWIQKVQSYNYTYDYKILNSADFGAYTSRKRYFAQFAKSDFPIVWPEQTHSKKVENSLFNDVEKWKPVKEVLDLEDYGNSIFTRKKPLVDNTLKVIMKGLVKAIEENEKAFMFKYYGNGDNYNSLNSPAGTVTTKDRFAVVQLIFNQYKTGNITDIKKPIGSVTTNPKANLLTFIFNPAYGGHTHSINKPCPTIVARQDKSPLYLLTAIMSKHNILDVKMRMLKIPELKQIMGFPIDYVLIGNQKDQKKFIGNAVEVTISKKICEAISLKLIREL